jgi:hypothetical protein
MPSAKFPMLFVRPHSRPPAAEPRTGSLLMQRQILKLTSLEILDLCHNKLTSIPIDIANSTSLKVLSIYKNTIKELPLCLGNLKSLQVLKFSGSQLVLPPPEVYALSDSDSSLVDENERDAIITLKLKKFMRTLASEVKESAEPEQLRVESLGEKRLEFKPLDRSSCPLINRQLD